MAFHWQLKRPMKLLYFFSVYIYRVVGIMVQTKGKSWVKFHDPNGKEIRIWFYYDQGIIGEVASQSKDGYTDWQSIATDVAAGKLTLHKPKTGDKTKYQRVGQKIRQQSGLGPESEEMSDSDNEGTPGTEVDEKHGDTAKEVEVKTQQPNEPKETADEYKNLPDLTGFNVKDSDYNKTPRTIPGAGTVFVQPESWDSGGNDEETLDEKNYNKALKDLDSKENKEEKEEKGTWSDYTTPQGVTVKVWTEWLETAKEHDFIQLLKKVNKQPDIIDNEMRRYVHRKQTTHGAKSVSFLAAVRTLLKAQGVPEAFPVGKKKEPIKNLYTTDDVGALLQVAIEHYWSTVDNKNMPTFEKMVHTLANCTDHENRGTGILFHLKQFKLSQEKQLIGKIKRETLWHLVESKQVSDWTGSVNYKDAKKENPLRLLQMSQERHIAGTTLDKNKRNWEQSHPLTFIVSKVIAFKNKLVQSNNIHDKILLVILCVGSRWIEVVQMSDFYVAADTEWKDAAEQKESSYYGSDPTKDIIVRGIAKARKKTEGQYVYVDQDTIEEKQATVDFERQDRFIPPKPVLFLTVKAIQYLVYHHIRPYIRAYCQSKFKKDLEEVEPKELAEHLNRKSNERLRRYDLTMDNRRDNKRLTSHALRKVYGNYSYELYGNNRTTKIAWLNRVLGHKPSSFSTALHYNTASVFDAIPKDQDYGDKNIIIADIKQATEEAREINDTLKLWREEDVVANVTRIIQSMAGKRPLMIDNRSDAANLGKIPFVTKKRKIIYLDPVQRSGISHTERQQKFIKTRDTFTAHSILHSYDNYNRLGFSSSYIAKQKKQQI